MIPCAADCSKGLIANILPVLQFVLVTVLVTITILSFPDILGTERTGCCHCLESKEVR